MRILGVRLDDGALVWADAGEHDPAPLDRVVLDSGESGSRGVVVITAGQLRRPPKTVDGVVLQVAPYSTDPDCRDLPHAHLPPLGTRVSAHEIRGMVTALDVVHDLVTVRQDNGHEETIAAADIETT